jgi:hypothetical protein
VLADGKSPRGQDYRSRALVPRFETWVSTDERGAASCPSKALKSRGHRRLARSAATSRSRATCGACLTGCRPLRSHRCGRVTKANFGRARTPCWFGRAGEGGLEHDRRTTLRGAAIPSWIEQCGLPPRRPAALQVQPAGGRRVERGRARLPAWSRTLPLSCGPSVSSRSSCPASESRYRTAASSVSTPSSVGLMWRGSQQTV